MHVRGRILAAGGAIILVLALAAFLFLQKEPPPEPGSVEVEVSGPTESDSELVPAEDALPGDDIMSGYAAPDGSAMQDLDHVFHVLDVFQLLLKIDGGLPLGSNEEIVAALTGTNPHRMVFLSADNPAINDAGQLVDRWRTPLFFHAVSRARIDIRSAGPDRTMWTGDDIHRNANGSFLGDGHVVPESLFGDDGKD